MRIRVHVFITGDVQGVFFRSSTRSQANLLGISGWVKNAIDGRVEAVFEGDSDLVEKMVEFCRQGPLGARVDDVEVRREKPMGEKGFEIK